MAVKSIRKDDVNVTATQLGVKVGDKFVVLSPQGSYKGEHHASVFSVGSVVTLRSDDDSACPLFLDENMKRGFESFACLARYEEQLEEKTQHMSGSLKITKAIYEVEDIPVSVSHFVVEGLTPEQYIRIITFIDNIKQGNL